MKYTAPSRCLVDRRRAAYTLTELLVVIFIILVLAWFLTPFYPHSHAKAWQSSCASHMKQIGIAFGQYLTDYDGVYPNYDNFKTKIRSQPPEPYANVSSESEWYTVLQPYMPSTSYRPAPENDNVLRCPLDTSLAPADPKNPDRKKEYVSSYSVNGWSEYDLAASAVKSPSSWVLMGERNNENRGPNGPWMFYFWTWQGKPRVWPPAATPVPTDKAAKDLVLTRHSERANWLYGDGHVKWVRFPDLWRGGSENPFWPDATP